MLFLKTSKCFFQKSYSEILTFFEIILALTLINSFFYRKKARNQRSQNSQIKASAKKGV